MVFYESLILQSKLKNLQVVKLIDRPVFQPDLATEALLGAILLESLEKRKAAFERWAKLIHLDDVSPAQFGLLGELAHMIDELAPLYEHRARLIGMKKYVWSNNINILHPSLPILDAFNADKISFIVLKGGGVIARDSSAISRRFIRDLDLMVSVNQIPLAVDNLIAMGWRPVSGRIPGGIRAQTFDKTITDAQGLQRRVEIDLHRCAHHLGRNSSFDDEFYQNSQKANLLGRDVDILHPTDLALLSLMHGGIYSKDPNFAWLTDVIRSIRHPQFSWDHFSNSISSRKLLSHAKPILKYLENNFELKIHSKLLKDIDVTHSYLFERESLAISLPRENRGISGRLLMFVAEVWRSKKLFYKVKYTSDLGFGCRHLLFARESDEFDYKISFLGNDKSRIQIRININDHHLSHKKLDYDLWDQDKWLARVRLRSSFPFLRSMNGIWTCSIGLKSAVNLKDLKLIDVAIA